MAASTPLKEEPEPAGMVRVLSDLYGYSKSFYAKVDMISGLCMASISE